MGFFAEIDMKPEKKQELNKALAHIGDRKKDGAFTVRAKKLQQKYHSSITILQRLRKNN